jgi:hypothetical protein
MSGECALPDDVAAIVELWDAMLQISDMQPYLSASPQPPDSLAKLSAELDQRRTDSEAAALTFFTTRESEFSQASSQLTKEIGDLETELWNLAPRLRSVVPAAATTSASQSSPKLAPDYPAVLAFIQSPRNPLVDFARPAVLDDILTYYELAKSELTAHPELGAPLSRFEAQVKGIPRSIMRSLDDIDSANFADHQKLFRSQMSFVAQISRHWDANATIEPYFNRLVARLLSSVTSPLARVTSFFARPGGESKAIGNRIDAVTDIPRLRKGDDLFVLVVPDFVAGLSAAYLSLGQNVGAVFDGLWGTKATILATFRKNFSTKVVADFKETVSKCRDYGALSIVAVWLRRINPDPIHDIFRQFRECVTARAGDLSEALDSAIVGDLGRALSRTNNVILGKTCTSILDGIVATLKLIAKDIEMLGERAPDLVSELPITAFVPQLTPKVGAVLGECPSDFQVLTVVTYLTARVTGLGTFAPEFRQRVERSLRAGALLPLNDEELRRLARNRPEFDAAIGVVVLRYREWFAREFKGMDFGRTVGQKMGEAAREIARQFGGSY